MKNRRLTGFILAIAVGLGIGLAYGWFINPPDAKYATLDSLRSDYQADYVLMIAEKFAVDRDALGAKLALRNISPDDSAACIKQALIMGQQLGYSEGEMQAISALEAAVAAPASGLLEATP